MFASRMYMKIVFVVFVVQLCLPNANGIEQDTEEKDIRKPVALLKHNNENDKHHGNFHKRQINPDFSQLGQSFEPQYFQQSFIPGDPNAFSDERLNNQFPNTGNQDEEERFFLSRETTTLNPLSFGPPPPSTENPLQQQLADDQRRFQQEIADKGLREQQEQAFGVPRPRTTTPPPQPQPFQPDQAFYDDPSISPSLQPQLPQDGIPYTDDFNQPYYPARQFRSIRSPRSIDRQLGSHNDLDFLSSTASPQSYFNNLIQHSTPKEDLNQISNWLVDNLTKRIQKNIAQLTHTASKRYQHSTPKPTSSFGLFSTEAPKPTSLGSHYSTEAPYYSTTKATPLSLYSTETSKPTENYGFQYSTEAPKPTQNYGFQYSTEALKPTQNYGFQYSTEPPKPTQNYGFQYSTEAPKPTQNYGFQYSTEAPKPTPNFGLHYSTEAPIQVPIYQSSFDQSTPKSVDVTPYPNWNNIRSITTPSNINFMDNFESKRLQSFDDFESKKIKSVQILPYSTDQPSYEITAKPYDNTVYQAYKQVYDIDHQTIKPVTSTAPNIDTSFLQIINNQPSPTVSVTSLFKSKLNELKENEKPYRQTPQYSDFQQHNRFFDQLGNPENNYTESTTPGYDTNSASAIFIKVPQDEPTSTVGFLFDKTITKNIHKKENTPSKNKNNNRSAQLIKSSLVYRTPPGKRATVSRSEISRSNQVDTGLLSNLLLGDSSKPFKWLLGNNTPTTTSRPFVTALWNLIQKRATAEFA